MVALLNAEGWYALGTMLIGVGVLAGGFWALYNYSLTRRTEAAHWLQGVFKDFYLSGTFREVRLLLEYGFPERAGPLLERRITNREIPVTPEETLILEELDTLLNYFEHVLYLEERKQITRSDRQAVFEYWFDILGEPERGGLRLYVARFGFERVAKVLNASSVDYIAVYGSLRKGFGLADVPDELEDMLVDRGRCVIPGDLFDLGDYPGLMPGRGRIVGELFEVKDERAFTLLDQYERFDPSDTQNSLYIRRCIRLLEPAADAWLYVFNQDVTGRAQVTSGDWAEHQRSKSGSAD